MPLGEFDLKEWQERYTAGLIRERELKMKLADMAEHITQQQAEIAALKAEFQTICNIIDNPSFDNDMALAAIEDIARRALESDGA
jgi:cell division protein FtsB